jgi:hypothetical protein
MIMLVAKLFRLPHTALYGGEVGLADGSGMGHGGLESGRNHTNAGQSCRPVVGRHYSWDLLMPAEFRPARAFRPDEKDLK